MAYSDATRFYGEEHPFLALQMNSFLRRIRNDDYSPGAAGIPHLYRKPEAITEGLGEELPRMWLEQKAFSSGWRDRIEGYIKSYGLGISLTENQDTARIKEFLQRRYPPELAQEICAFDLYRFRKFGHGVILEADNGEVMGTIFEVGYHTPEHTSYTIRLAVDEALAGKNLGYHLMVYSSLVAMENGSRVKRGLIEFSNLHSLYINLNKVGWICDGFDPDISGLGAFFEIALPLDPPGLTGNVIDMDKVAHFLGTYVEGTDYLLLSNSDLEGIKNMYRETDFKVVAILKPGVGGAGWKFLALPAAAIQLREW